MHVATDTQVSPLATDCNQICVLGGAGAGTFSPATAGGPRRARRLQRLSQSQDLTALTHHSNQGENTMADKDTGPEAGVKGVVEDVKGKAKEAVGAVTGDDEMKREGAAQQDKAAAKREVAAKEAEAEKARAEAEAHEAEQRSHQR
jgi:uncharacterized protein YjbJ (UPF0337 family)